MPGFGPPRERYQQIDERLQPGCESIEGICSLIGFRKGTWHPAERLKTLSGAGGGKSGLVETEHRRIALDHQPVRGEQSRATERSMEPKKASWRHAVATSI